MAEEKTEIPQDNDDVFSAAFAQLSAANEAAKSGDVTPPAVAVEEPVVQVEEKVETPAAKVEEPKVEPPAAIPALKPTPVSDEEIARIAAITAAQMRPQPQQRDPQPQEPQIFSQEDIDFLNSYQAEYSDIARGEALLRRKDILDAVKFVFGEVSKVVRPIEAIAQQLNARTHLGDLQRLIPEQPLTREEAVAWAQQQPDFLQPGYFHVIQRGTAEQVAAMTKHVRASQAAATPVAGSAGNVAAAVAAPVTQVREDPAAKKALAALTPVPTKRSGVSTDALEPNNFDSAFERFSALADAVKR
jgi:hypothetical protein